MTKILPFLTAEEADDFKAEMAAKDRFDDALLFRDEIGTTLDVRDYYRNFDVQDHKNMEAIAKAEMDAVIFQAKRYAKTASVDARVKAIDEVVVAVTKATISTARRMKREEELRRMERDITKYLEKAKKLGIELPDDWR